MQVRQWPSERYRLILAHIEGVAFVAYNRAHGHLQHNKYGAVCRRGWAEQKWPTISDFRQLNFTRRACHCQARARLRYVLEQYAVLEDEDVRYTVHARSCLRNTDASILSEKVLRT
jgi:hypothetical protein